MTKLVSKQHTNDGAYHIKRLVTEANGRLKQIGRQGKRAVLVAKGGSLTLVFTFHDGNGKSQKNVGLGGIVTSANGILEAEKIARMVTDRLVTGEFTWDWYNNLIGKPTSEQNKQLTCKEMVEQYKKHFFKQRKDNKSPESAWYQACDALERVLGSLDKPLSLNLIREIVESKENNSDARRYTLNGLVGFFKYFDIDDYKSVIKDYKENNKLKRKQRNVPSDERIVEVYDHGFEPPYNAKKQYAYRYSQWQFLYGLLATYGLRIHEAWNIANWDKPVTFKNGDWVTVGTDDDNEELVQRTGEDTVIPAILDPDNKLRLLCIKDSTKTGYRIAFPLSPEGHNWVEEFNLLQPFNLPDIPNPLLKDKATSKGFVCSQRTCKWFRNRKYGFTPHDLRHAFNHRAHQSSINPKAVADSLGHSMTMNQSGYLKHMSNDVKLKGITDAITKEQSKRSRVQELETEVETLKAQLAAKDNEIELLKTKLKLNKTIQES